MGSEHSTQASAGSQQKRASFSVAPQKAANFRRQRTIANPGAREDNSEFSEGNGRPRSISPGPSVCSDVDLPYISYTVNRPIGDSPKLANKQLLKQKSTPRKIAQKTPKKTPTHNIVVVKQGSNPPHIEKDEDVMRLQNIPMFLPIMRATLNLPAARDPEVLERLDPAPLHRLCIRYQNHLTSCANMVATEQNALTQKVREIDLDITRMVNIASDRQKKYGKYAERLSKVSDLTLQLNKCHIMLNQTLELMEQLNNFLDIENRLEPFVWTTG